MVRGEEKKIFIVIESELDGILLNQELDDLAGCIALGSASNRPDTATTGLLRNARQVLIGLDSDSSGARESWKWWPENFNRARRLPPVSGKDPGEMMKAGVDLRAWVAARLSQSGQVDALSAGSSGDNADSFDYLINADPETLELFGAALKGIETGGPLSRLFLQAANYLLRELGPDLFGILERAHEEVAQFA